MCLTRAPQLRRAGPRRPFIQQVCSARWRRAEQHAGLSAPALTRDRETCSPSGSYLAEL